MYTRGLLYSLIYPISAPWSWITRLGRPEYPLVQAGPRTPGRWPLAWLACVLRPLYHSLYLGSQGPDEERHLESTTVILH
jgi:hypothetical protein